MLALLPPRWLVPWTTDVADLLWLPLRPAVHGLGTVASWLRPPPESGAAEAPLQKLTEERDEFRALWMAERLRVVELQERLEQVEAAARFERGGPSNPVYATVVGRGASPRGGLLVLNVGSDAGVAAGDPGVIRGDVLVGRIAEEPTKVQSYLVPIVHPGAGRMDVVVVPAAHPEAPVGTLCRMQLVPDAKGLLVGEAVAGAGVAEGDTLRLADATWSPGAQGLRLGTVSRVMPLESNPLRVRVEVRPEAEPGRLASLVLRTGKGASP